MAESLRTKDAAAWVQERIRNFVCRSPENSLRNQAKEPAWKEPLVGFSGGNDPLYQAYKEYVGPFHWTPLEIFSLTFPETTAGAEELTVISWVLPQIAATKADNRRETAFPSERWVRARIFGEEANVALRNQLVAALKEAGVCAVAPALSPLCETTASERYSIASRWSERHAAYASGLGTFGLCDGLITPKGKAMRCGSVVARIAIPATPRPYHDHRAYCLFFSKGGCGTCIRRCPVGAITTAGHDKVKCRNYLYSDAKDYVASRFGLEGYACGLCQTGVPCESGIPVLKAHGKVVTPREVP